jgi:phosphate:Na+ symporter
MGVLIFLPFIGVIMPELAKFDPDPARMLVNFHTFFNWRLPLYSFPFIVPMTKLSEIILPDRNREEDESLPRYLDPTATVTPPAALACAARETLRISDLIQRILQDTLEALRSNNPRIVQTIRDRESIVDSLYESVKKLYDAYPVEILKRRGNAQVQADFVFLDQPRAYRRYRRQEPDGNGCP